MDYAQTIPNADRIRLAAHVLSLANAVQQTADISTEDLWHARETTTLFQEVDDDDTMAPGYHLHIMLEDLADNFDELANAMDECGADAKAAARDAALAKLTDAEKAALGVE
jgi:hypothetical protein